MRLLLEKQSLRRKPSRRRYVGVADRPRDGRSYGAKASPPWPERVSPGTPPGSGIVPGAAAGDPRLLQKFNTWDGTHPRLCRAGPAGPPSRRLSLPHCPRWLKPHFDVRARNDPPPSPSPDTGALEVGRRELPENMTRRSQKGLWPRARRGSLGAVDGPHYPSERRLVGGPRRSLSGGRRRRRGGAAPPGGADDDLTPAHFLR